MLFNLQFIKLFPKPYSTQIIKDSYIDFQMLSVSNVNTSSCKEIVKQNELQPTLSLTLHSEESPFFQKGISSSMKNLKLEKNDIPGDWHQKTVAYTIYIQLLKAYRIKFQKFAAHAHKDALINETFIPT